MYKRQAVTKYDTNYTRSTYTTKLNNGHNADAKVHKLSLPQYPDRCKMNTNEQDAINDLFPKIIQKLQNSTKTTWTRERQYNQG